MIVNDVVDNTIEISKSSSYDAGRWDMFEHITSIWYGKQCYFLQDDGQVYSRMTCEYMSKEEAVNEFLTEINPYNE